MAEKWFNISELADLVGGEWRGDHDVPICALTDLRMATEGHIAYLEKGKHIEDFGGTGASALIISNDSEIYDLPVIITNDPVWAAAVIHNHLIKEEFVAKGVHSQAVIGSDCLIPEQVTIGAKAVLGERVKLGDRVVIGPGSVIGDNVSIGNDVTIHPNVSILDRSVLGDRVIVHSGTVIGSDGFGYAHDPNGRHVKRPHAGHVQIDEDVEIGSNVSVDRGTFGRTWIKRGTKIDNLVQVAHNVEIGEDTLIAGQSGISGSTIVGNGVIMAGHTALSGHLKIGDRVVVTGKAGVIGDQEDGVVVSGFPAFSHRKWLRANAVFRKLPELIKEIGELRKKVQDSLDRSTDQSGNSK